MKNLVRFLALRLTPLLVAAAALVPVTILAQGTITVPGTLCNHWNSNPNTIPTAVPNHPELTVSFTSASYKPQGSILPNGKAVQSPFCQVVGWVSGTSGVHDGFEFDFPNTWNYDFLMEGEGGFAGIPLPNNGQADPDLYALSANYALGNTDTGHYNDDASWAINQAGTLNVGAVNDYFYLAVHNVTLVGKALVSEYYTAANTIDKSYTLNKAYFCGCSNPGRQAMMEAERYPDDFDGIAAGDPPLTFRDYVQMLAGEYALLQIGSSGGPSLSAFLNLGQVPLVDQAIYQECGSPVGTVSANGSSYTYYLIQNPQACNFNPQTLLGSLSQAQINALNYRFREVGLMNVPSTYPMPPGQEAISLGYSMSDLSEGLDGSAADAANDVGLTLVNVFEGQYETQNGVYSINLPSPTAAEPWGAVSTQPPAWFFADQTFKYLVSQNPNLNSTQIWLSPNVSGQYAIDYASLNSFDRLTAKAAADEPAALVPYFAKGGKLLMYQGFSDQLISPYAIIHFYKELAAYIGAQYAGVGSDTAGYPILKNYARLFLAPGMHHCGGGPGPGGLNVLKALTDWVEQGVTPEGDGTGYGQNPMNVFSFPPAATGLPQTAATALQMPLCAFPEMARLTPGANGAQPANWSCPPNDTSLLTVGQNGREAGLAAQTQDTIRGGLAGISSGSEIQGWACDYGSTAQIYVDLYVGDFARRGGTFVGRFQANDDDYGPTDDAAIAQQCGIQPGGHGHGHRFSIPTSAAAGYAGQAIYLHGVSSVAGSYNAPLANSGVFQIP